MLMKTCLVLFHVSLLLLFLSREVAQIMEKIVARATNSNSIVEVSEDRTIINNVQWVDTDGNILLTSRGGRITKLNNTFYWLGGSPGQILFYKSHTLGSNSWTLDGKIKHKLGSKILGNCRIHYHPKYHRHHIFCKARNWFLQEEQEEQQLEPNAGKYVQLPRPAMPLYPPLEENYIFGGQSTYQEGRDLYLVVSCAVKGYPEKRTLFIYKLNDEWTGFDSEVVRFVNKGMESPWLLKRNDTYYLFQSQTRRWEQSLTYYRRAPSMKELADVDFERIIIHPRDNSVIKSLGSQFRFIMQPKEGQDKWVFGGDRFPEEDPEHWDRKYGRFVMSPVKFIDGIPHVYWKEVFDWKKYKYDGKDYDSYNSGGYGPTPLTAYNNEAKLA